MDRVKEGGRKGKEGEGESSGFSDFHGGSGHFLVLSPPCLFREGGVTGKVGCIIGGMGSKGRGDWAGCKREMGRERGELGHGGERGEETSAGGKVQNEVKEGGR